MLLKLLLRRRKVVSWQLELFDSISACVSNSVRISKDRISLILCCSFENNRINVS